MDSSHPPPHIVDLRRVSPTTLRSVPNWANSPVPLCLGGDWRALTYCCKPGCALNHAAICLRDSVLAQLEITGDAFIRIKEAFSQEHAWEAEETCFGSLSYCCMRAKGCDRRDAALARRYPDLSPSDRLAEYFRLKKILAEKICTAAHVIIQE